MNRYLALMMGGCTAALCALAGCDQPPGPEGPSGPPGAMGEKGAMGEAGAAGGGPQVKVGSRLRPVYSVTTYTADDGTVITKRVATDSYFDTMLQVRCQFTGYEQTTPPTYRCIPEGATNILNYFADAGCRQPLVRWPRKQKSCDGSEQDIGPYPFKYAAASVVGCPSRTDYFRVIGEMTLGSLYSGSYESFCQPVDAATLARLVADSRFYATTSERPTTFVSAIWASKYEE